MHAPGTTDMVLLLAAYVLNSHRRLSPQSLAYQVLNLLGTMILIAYSVIPQAWASVALNLIWAVIAASPNKRTASRTN